MNGRNYTFSKVKALRKGIERNASLFTVERINFFPLIFSLYLPLCKSLHIRGPEANISVVAFHSLIPANSYRRYSFLLRLQLPDLPASWRWQLAVLCWAGSAGLIYSILDLVHPPFPVSLYVPKSRYYIPFPLSTRSGVCFLQMNST